MAQSLEFKFAFKSNKIYLNSKTKKTLIYGTVDFDYKYWLLTFEMDLD